MRYTFFRNQGTLVEIEKVEASSMEEAVDEIRDRFGPWNSFRFAGEFDDTISVSLQPYNMIRISTGWKSELNLTLDEAKDLLRKLEEIVKIL